MSAMPSPLHPQAMPYRRLGRTDLRISAISLGTVELGLDYGIPDGGHTRPDEARAAQLLNRALDLGINFIDTARAYGTSEGIIGRALHARRNEYFLATKVGLPREGELSANALRAHVETSIHTSLRELRTDHVDVLMFHSAPTDWHQRDDVLACLQRAQAAGQTRFVGASVYGASAALNAINDGSWDCLQIAVNALDRQMEQTVLPLAAQRDVGMVVRSVLLKGALTHRHAQLPIALADLKGAVQSLMSAAKIEPGELPALAYRYALAQTGVATALVGTAQLAELEAGVACAGLPPLSADVVQAIRAITLAHPEQLNPATWPIQ